MARCVLGLAVMMAAGGCEAERVACEEQGCRWEQGQSGDYHCSCCDTRMHPGYGDEGDCEEPEEQPSLPEGMEPGGELDYVCGAPPAGKSCDACGVDCVHRILVEDERAACPCDPVLTKIVCGPDRRVADQCCFYVMFVEPCTD